MSGPDPIQLATNIDRIIEKAEQAREMLLAQGISAQDVPTNLNEIVSTVNEIEKAIPGCRPALLEAERLTDEILDVILSLAALDFTKTVRVGYEDSNFDAVAAGLNMLGEELQRSTVSKAYVDNILSSMSDALIVLNPDKTLNTVNDYARSLLGYEEADLDGQPAQVLFQSTPDFLQNGEIQLPKSSDKGQADVVFKTKDGKPIPMQIKGSLMTDAAGNPAGMVLVARDMRETYRLIASAEAANHRLSEANSSLEKQVQYRKLAEEKLQQAHDSLEMQVEDRTAALSKTNLLLNQEIEERKRAEAETRAREKKYRDIFENTSVSVWEADVTAALELIKDLKEENEEAFENIESDQEQSDRILNALNIIDINSATSALFEAPNKELFLAEVQKTFQPSSKEKFIGALKAFASGQELYESEAEFLTLSGQKKTMHLLISLQRRPGENTYSTLINLIDISQQRELEGQLRQSQKMEAIGRLAGGVAHDFNNLLTVILNYGEMLVEEIPAEDKKHKKIEQIVECAERAASLTQQLLAFSRKQVVALKELDLNQSIAKMDKMLRRLLGEDIDFVSNLDPNIGSVKGDISQIEQIILNLSVNARDAMPRGGKLIIETTNMDIDEEYINHHPTLKPGKYVMVSITDTGEGMSDQVKSKIFEPFFTTKGLGKGTGLGLSTVYGNIQQSGGHVWVYSEVGLGTTFRIFFPRVHDSKEETEDQLADESCTQGTGTILVVDDEEKVKNLAASILRKNGYHIIEASTAGQAIQLSKQFGEKIDLLLSDVIMPSINGPELAKRLSKTRPDMKILYMSGYTDKAISQHGILPPETLLVQKPFNQKVLTQKVREALENKAEDTGVDAS